MSVIEQYIAKIPMIRYDVRIQLDRDLIDQINKLGEYSAVTRYVAGAVTSDEDESVVIMSGQSEENSDQLEARVRDMDKKLSKLLEEQYARVKDQYEADQEKERIRRLALIEETKGHRWRRVGDDENEGAIRIQVSEDGGLSWSFPIEVYKDKYEDYLSRVDPETKHIINEDGKEVEFLHALWDVSVTVLHSRPWCMGLKGYHGVLSARQEHTSHTLGPENHFFRHLFRMLLCHAVDVPFQNKYGITKGGRFWGRLGDFSLGWDFALDLSHLRGRILHDAVKKALLISSQNYAYWSEVRDRVGYEKAYMILQDYTKPNRSRFNPGFDDFGQDYE